MAQLYLIRHGSTMLNDKQRRVRGWLDVPLNPKGLQEANQTAQVAKQLGVTNVFHCDLNRTTHTGQIIANACQVPAAPDHTLRPWQLGELTGVPAKEAAPQIDHFLKNPKSTVPGGESFNDFSQRWEGSLQKYAKMAIQNPKAKIALVTHSRNIEALRYKLTGNKKPLLAGGLLKPGGIASVQLHPDGMSLHHVWEPGQTADNNGSPFK